MLSKTTLKVLGLGILGAMILKAVGPMVAPLVGRVPFVGGLLARSLA